MIPNLPNFNGIDLNQFGQMNNQILQPQNIIEENINYYQEACKLYIANVVLTTQMKELVAEKNELLAKIAKLEKKVNENQSSSFQAYEDKKKRHRRIATEIDRHYRCPLEGCQKSYGSEGSLTQHIKLKHPDYFAKMGLSQINLKNLDEDSKSINDSMSDDLSKNDESSIREKEESSKDFENSKLPQKKLKKEGTKENDTTSKVRGKTENDT